MITVFCSAKAHIFTLAMEMGLIGAWIKLQRAIQELDINSTISPTRYMKINMNIRPCFVETFNEGSQVSFESLLLDLNEFKVVPFRNFTQYPDCLYNVTYSLTLVEKENFLEEEIPEFSYEAEQPEESFISLDVEL